MNARQETIANDLTLHKDKPLWPLSSYAPAKGEPNVIGGLDESPEELRVRAHMARQAGNMNEYVRISFLQPTSSLSIGFR